MYQYPVGVSTMILNTVFELVGKGNEVALFMDEQTYTTATFDYSHPRFSLHLYPTEAHSIAYRALRKGKFLFGNLSGYVRANLAAYARAYDPQLPRFLAFLRLGISDEFTHIIGVEPLGIALAAQVVGDRKLLYYNMELLQEKSCPDARWKSIKAIERGSIEEVGAVVIQNDQRAAVFAKENNFDRNRIVLLPILPLGDCISGKTDGFRTKFGIQSDKCIVLYAGNFQPWALCHEIIQSVRQWDHDFVLVMHTWNRACLSTRYYKEMVELARNLPVCFSTEPVEYTDFPALVASADVGLMFYQAIDENFTEIMSSSNKLAEYMKACLPIVVFEGGSLGDFVLSRRIGEGIRSFNNLSTSLRQIRRNYESYRRACKDCYEKELSFSKHFDQMWEEIS
jgi:hypothetical protein